MYVNKPFKYGWFIMFLCHRRYSEAFGSSPGFHAQRPNAPTFAGAGAELILVMGFISNDF